MRGLRGATGAELEQIFSRKLCVPRMAVPLAAHAIYMATPQCLTPIFSRVY